MQVTQVPIRCTNIPLPYQACSYSFSMTESWSNAKKKFYGVSIIKKIVDRKKITHQERQRFDNLVLHIQEHSNCKLDTTNKIKVQIASISFFLSKYSSELAKKNYMPHRIAVIVTNIKTMQ